MVGIDPQTSLVADPNGITFRSHSLSGESYYRIPLRNVSIAYCGYHKPIVALVLACAFAIASFVSFDPTHSNESTIVSIIGALVCLVYYWLRKFLSIGIWTTSGYVLGLSFRPSVIEGVSVDINRTFETIQVLTLMLNAAGGTSDLGQKLVSDQGQKLVSEAAKA